MRLSGSCRAMMSTAPSLPVSGRLSGGTSGGNSVSSPPLPRDTRTTQARMASAAMASMTSSTVASYSYHRGISPALAAPGRSVGGLAELLDARPYGLRAGFEVGEGLLDRGGPGDGVEDVGPGEPGVVHAADQVPERPVEPPRVEEHQRPVVDAEHPRRPHLEQLLQRADAAGQHEERVGPGVHLALALAHVGRDDQLVGVAVGDLDVDEDLRDDADGPAAGGAGCAGDLAHAGDGGAAAHQGVAAPGQLGPDLGGQAQVLVVDEAAGGAEDADVHGG